MLDGRQAGLTVAISCVERCAKMLTPLKIANYLLHIGQRWRPVMVLLRCGKSHKQDAFQLFMILLCIYVLISPEISPRLIFGIGPDVCSRYTLLLISSISCPYHPFVEHKSNKNHRCAAAAINQRQVRLMGVEDGRLSPKHLFQIPDFSGPCHFCGGCSLTDSSPSTLLAAMNLSV